MAALKKVLDRRLYFAVFSIVIYAALFMLMAYKPGKGMAIAVIIPIVIIAWLYGVWAGICAGVLSPVVNILMCMLLGLDWIEKFYVGGVGIAGTLIEVLIGVVVGKLHDYNKRIQDELAVRTALEAELQQHRTRLEEMVRAKTSELELANEQLRASQLEIRQARDYLENLFKATPDAIIVTDADGYIVSANESVFDVYGYRPDELIGQHVSALTPADENTWRENIGLVERVYEQGLVRNWVGERQHKDGRILHIETSVVLLKNPDSTASGSISSSRDITDRKRLEEQLRQSRDYLEKIFMTSPDAIIVADDAGYIVMANESVFDVYGYRPEEVIGQHGSLFTPQDEKSYEKRMPVLEELYERGFVRNVVSERRLKDGGLIWTEASYVLLKNPDGSVAGSVSSSRNITDRKRFEEQLRQSQKMEAIGTLAGGIAHDFNNILGAIIGYTELSQDLTDDAETLQSNLLEVLKAAERAKNLVRQILAFSRKSESELKALPLHLVVKEALNLLRSSIPTTISIKADIASANDIVIADATQMHQIVMNLCTNAAHAMRQGGGVLEVTLKAVDLDDYSVGAYFNIAPGPYVRLSFKDTGTGIPGNIIDRIFEPFFTTKELGAGTGMGLAVVHGIVKSLKGDIKVYSEPGRGTVFHVLLPRVEAALPDQRAAPPALPRGSESVLLVDDEQALLDAGGQILGSLGYRVTAMKSPLDALELFSKNPSAFDVVITDQTMSGLTGYELAQRLMEMRKDLPVILCTGYSDLVTAESALAGGIKAFVIKPLTRFAVAETIRAALDKK